MVAVRIFIFSLLPIFVAAAQVGLDKGVGNRERQLEVYLVYLFGLGVAANGLSGFFGHFFISDVVAESIGWPGGSPFQLEIGFANLALGVLGIIAMGRRDGFREATVTAVSFFGVGATIVHVMDIVQTGNLAPGNTLQNASNLLKPALLVGFLVASRRAERSADSEVGTPEFESWREPRVKAAGVMTACVGIGFGLGFATGQPTIGTALGILIGASLVAYVLTRHTNQLFAGQSRLPHE
jgi:hypothetical protein